MAGWFLHGLLTGIDLAAIALGFYLFMRVCRIMNFSYGGVIVLAPYVLGTFIDGGHPLIAGVFSICCASVLAIGLEASAFAALRRRNAQPVVSLVASLGLFVMIQSLLQIFWGPERKALGSPTAAGLVIDDFHLSYAGLALKGLCVLSILGLYVFLFRTRTGSKLRALSCDADLANAVGISSRQLFLLCSGIAAGFGAIGALSTSLQFGYDAQMGQDLLFLVFPAVILGGRTYLGVIFSSIAIQMLRVGGLRFMPKHAVELILFSLVIVVLLVSALFARRRRTG